MVLLALLLQTALLGRLPLPGPAPDLVLLVVIGVAITAGANVGAITGFAAGILAAIAPPALAPVGLAAMLYAITGYVVGGRAGGEQLSRTETAGIAAAAGGAVGALTLMAMLWWGQPVPMGQGAAAVLLQAAYCGLLAVLVAPAVGTAVAAVPGRG